jgi:hypothetical protein
MSSFKTEGSLFSWCTAHGLSKKFFWFHQIYFWVLANGGTPHLILVQFQRSVFQLCQHLLHLAHVWKDWFLVSFYHFGEALAQSFQHKAVAKYNSASSSIPKRSERSWVNSFQASSPPASTTASRITGSKSSPTDDGDAPDKAAHNLLRPFVLFLLILLRDS